MNKTILYPIQEWARMILLNVIVFMPLSALAGYGARLTNPDFENLHMIFALLTSGIFIAVLGLALLLFFQTRRLHSVNANKFSDNAVFLDKLPSLLSLEKRLFQLLIIGFILLTILVGSGMLFADQVWGDKFIFNHKTVFTLLSWVVFATLIFGRYLRGWRGQMAITMTIFGFVLLFLSYVGTHFVLDVILKSTH